MVKQHPNVLIVFGADHGARDIALDHPIFNVHLPPMMMLVPKPFLSNNSGLSTILEGNSQEVAGGKWPRRSIYRVPPPLSI
jgi:hypothetical protein